MYSQLFNDIIYNYGHTDKIQSFWVIAANKS